MERSVSQQMVDQDVFSRVVIRSLSDEVSEEPGLFLATGHVPEGSPFLESRLTAVGTNPHDALQELLLLAGRRMIDPWPQGSVSTDGDRPAEGNLESRGENPCLGANEPADSRRIVDGLLSAKVWAEEIEGALRGVNPSSLRRGIESITAELDTAIELIGGSRRHDADVEG